MLEDFEAHWEYTRVPRDKKGQCSRGRWKLRYSSQGLEFGLRSGLGRGEGVDFTFCPGAEEIIG